jgi:hypothetical protein
LRPAYLASSLPVMCELAQPKGTQLPWVKVVKPLNASTTFLAPCGSQPKT